MDKEIVMSSLDLLASDEEIRKFLRYKYSLDEIVETFVQKMLDQFS